MRQSLTTLTLVGVLLGFAGPLAAQEDYEAGSADNYAFGIGGGLVDPSGSTEPYYTANLRIRLGSHDRSREDLQRQGVHGFIEPEIGYWTRDSGNSDLLVGANLIGVVPFNRVNYSFGVGAGLHFLDYTIQSGSNLLEESEEAVGVNAQFGIDVYMTDAVALFGTGRLDLVEGTVNDQQSKVYLGVRFFF